MKIRLLPLVFFAAVLVAGCGKQQTATNTAPSASTSGTPAATATPAVPTPAPTATTPPAATPTATPAGAPAAKSGAGRVVEITSNDQMKFSLATIEAKAGEELTVRLTNVGTLPKEAMGHNWVLLKKGVDVNAFAQAAMTAKDNDYIPPSMKDQVIAFTPVLGPKGIANVSFKAPAAGEYVYICSFPGHYMLMKGTLVVK